MMPRRCTHFPGSECLTKGSLAAVSRLPDQLVAAATDTFPFFSPPSLPEQKGFLYYAVGLVLESDTVCLC